MFRKILRWLQPGSSQRDELSDIELEIKTSRGTVSQTTISLDSDGNNQPKIAEEFDSCQELLDIILEGIRDQVQVPVYTERGKVNDWDGEFVLIGTPNIDINEGTKRCSFSIDVRANNETPLGELRQSVTDTVETVDSDPMFSSFSPTAGQFFVSSVISDIQPENCNHESVSTDYQVWPPPRWSCDDCGRQVCCECWKEFLKKTGRHNIDQFELKENVCWNCRGEEPPLGGGYAYASEFRKRHWQEVLYEYRELVIEGVDNAWRVAENSVREEHGVPKIGKQYVSETDLYQMMDSLLEDIEVVHHAHPEWLDGLEIDIFVPEMDVGIEYMGRQHFEPVEFFGGEESFDEQEKRDERKKEICEKRAVDLYYVNYDENLEKRAEQIADKIQDE